MIVNYEHYLETTKNSWFRGVLLINGIRRMEGLCASERLRAITLFDEKLKQWNSDNNANVPMMQNDVHMKGVAEAYVAGNSPNAPSSQPKRKEVEMTTKNKAPQNAAPRILFTIELSARGKYTQLNAKIKSDNPAHFIEEIQALVSSVEGRG